MDQWITCFTDSGVYPVCPADQANTRRNEKKSDKTTGKKPESVEQNGHVKAPAENKREALSYC